MKRRCISKWDAIFLADLDADIAPTLDAWAEQAAVLIIESGDKIPNVTAAFRSLMVDANAEVLRQATREYSWLTVFKGPQVFSPRWQIRRMAEPIELLHTLLMEAALVRALLYGEFEERYQRLFRLAAATPIGDDYLLQHVPLLFTVAQKPEALVATAAPVANLAARRQRNRRWERRPA